MFKRTQSLSNASQEVGLYHNNKVHVTREQLS